MTARSMSLSALLDDAGVRPLDAPSSDPHIHGVTIDSRGVRSGELFCALRGENFDGVTFAPAAIASGAGAVLADRPRPAAVETVVPWVEVEDARVAVGPIARTWFGRPDLAMTVVGVTGTNGKTSVTCMVDAIARAARRKTGRIGTIGYVVCGEERPAPRTTPEAPELYALLADMRDCGTDLVAIEVSSHALSQERVGGLRFAVAAFLNLSRDHLDFHGDMSSYLEAKAVLFDRLDAGATAVLPTDDPRGDALARRTAAGIMRFGRRQDADVRIVAESCGPDGIRVALRTPRGPVELTSPLVGRFHVDNVAAATACALATGIEPDAVRAGLAGLESVPGRTQAIRRGQPFVVLVDYAHTDDALSQVLHAARGIATGRVIAVFGCGGDRDRGKRAPMGAAAARLADVVVLTSDNPRHEDPDEILRDVVAGTRSVAGTEDRVRVEPDREAAIRDAVTTARAGDVVVIAGKGHENMQQIGDRTIPFDDRRVAERMLLEIGFGGGRCADA